MRRILSVVAVLAAVAGVAAPALAQVQTGSIFVRAVDQQGAVCRDLRVPQPDQTTVGSSTGRADRPLGDGAGALGHRT